MKECEIVKQHQKENDGKTNLKWLDEHIKNCELCKEIVNIVTSSFIRDLSEWNQKIQEILNVF